jgi:tetratricopeptide (TPR) repeat protein
MNLKTLLSRILPIIALAFLVATSASAQDAPTAPDNGTDARAEYGAAIDAAQEATALGTAEGHVAAAEAYLRAATVAEESGDDELVGNARGAREAAIRSFVDAGGVHARSEAHAAAATKFVRAAETAELIGDAELHSRVTFNAGTAFGRADDHAAAIAQFDRAIALQPDNLDYQFARALALRSAGDTDAAMAAFSELATAAQAAGNTELYTRIGETAGRVYLVQARDAIQAENWRGAIQALDQAARFLAQDDANLNTFYANAYYRQGVAQVQAEQWAAARASLQRAQQHARIAGRDQIVRGAQQQLDYIQQVQG